MSHAKQPEIESKYCYLGPAFRFPDELLSPQEFTQAGLEWFGDKADIAAEARVIKLAVSALEATGLSGLKVSLGDLGLFNALLDDMPMPERWRRRLRHQFWRPAAFRSLLETFAKPARNQRSSISENIDALDGRDAVVETGKLLATKDLNLVTQRSVEDIASRLAEKLADRSEQSLARDMVNAIESYLQISGPLTEVGAKIAKISNTPKFAEAIAQFEKRIAALEDQGLNPRRFHFSADFGRELEYYTGLVFQIEVEARNAPLSVAGGGRYDGLLQDLGASNLIPAVGCAIHTDRLLAVMS